MVACRFRVARARRGPARHDFEVAAEEQLVGHGRLQRRPVLVEPGLQVQRRDAREAAARRGDPRESERGAAEERHRARERFGSAT